MNVIKQISFLIALGLFAQSPLLAMKRQLNEESPKPIYEILAQQATDKEQRKSERMMIKKTISGHDHANFDANEFYLKIVEKYKKFEEHLWEIEDHMPQPSICGGINYTMTLDEMYEKTTEKFVTMKNDGLIISTADFEKIKDQYYTGHKHPHTDLIRIWGADYLKEKIDASMALRERYDVPKYIIVTDDPNNIEVDLDFGNEDCPAVSHLTNATIYFEKIIGSRVASWSPRVHSCVNDIGRSSGIGYDDLSDPGNIIKQERTGKYYVVDTERKSFHIKITRGAMFTYVWNRFKCLNSIETSCCNSFQIDLQS